MAQHDYNIANQTGLEFRVDVNNALQAIVTQNSGTSEPVDTFPGMFWLDTSVSPPVLKQRNQANDNWVTALSAINAQEVLVSGSNIKTINGASVLGSGDLVVGFSTFRNKIINGAMKVDQRNTGASQTFTAGAALAYCVDRWYGYCTGANISGQRIALSNGQNRYRFTGAASNTGVGFGQRIEAANSMDLAGLGATLSVKLSSSSLTSITWTAFRANTTDAFGTLASPTRTQIATGTFTISGTEAEYSVSISVPSAATTGIEIVLTGGALLETKTLTIGDIQLEVGSVATPFEHRPYGTELALCQGYFEAAGGAQVIFSGNVTSGSIYYAAGTYRQEKRAIPTVTLTNVFNAQFPAAVGTVAGSVSGFRSERTANATGNGVFIEGWTASSEL